MEPEPEASALEALTEFLYIAPVGLMQFTMDGTITLANPLAAQLLLPLTPTGDLRDAFSALAPLVPDLARQVTQYPGTSGIILDHERCEVTRGTKSSVFSVTVHRVHGGTNLLVLDDVTHLVHQERQLHVDRQRFRAIFNNVRDYAIYTVDPEGRIDEWNQSLERFGGWLPEDVAQRPFDIFFTEEQRGEGRMAELLARSRSIGSTETEGWRRRRDRARLWANTVVTVLPDVDGAACGFVVISRNMTERKRMEDELRRLATTDPLTGAFNRRSGHAVLAEAFNRQHGDGLRPGVVMRDIDHFKSIKDRHGHDVGDAALCALVVQCRGVLGDATPIVRWGGEEFLIILPSTSEDAAATIAESLRAAVEIARIPVAAGDISITASFGVAVDSGASPEILLKHADAALYAAKRRGRNRVILHKRPPT